MRAVHFGAGNIGRGFIGERLTRSGYEVCFVDVQAQLVEALQQRKGYDVHLLGEEVEALHITGVTALNSQTEPERVQAAIAQADLVTTAVGPTVLKMIAPLLAAGLRRRLLSGTHPLNVVACENMIGGSSFLKDEVTAHLTHEERQELERTIGFPDAAVDRIVPVQSGADLLQVSVEPFYEWVIEQSGIKGGTPAIDGVTYVDGLTPYIERKLYTVNTGHAVCAYAGRLLGYDTIREAMVAPRVAALVFGALEETGALLEAKHGFNRREHQDYIAKILSRFTNPRLTDPVARVGRSPIRKLGQSDRLVGPALQMLEHQLKPDRLASGIAAALFFDEVDDPEAIKLQQLLSQDGIAKTLQAIAGIPEESSLTHLVLQRYREWEEEIDQ
ncbi:mannitol-1-phosphate 5-dehydrogenase [Desmospora activa]|uniref:Mannitol-1-phosphate 5-dehydrogenase n=1 Tax=Desmospora activa DSM 45169 TaxID=1121389 RepID=A0A2T4ZAE8_9BACL|nr:mannitol-1-phosphate 5-dehydrogenase [Desmospora activa]PTM58862.1 mannitol-1-phosphate 5-dehydrogenase [Desmospora activa DSM 45169]